MIDVDIILAELVDDGDYDGVGDVAELAAEVAAFARDLQALVDAGLVKGRPGLGETRLSVCDNDDSGG